MPLVSVIIPNYNHARFLKERIGSVLEQTYRDFEVIILDDCSTDNSREIIESYRNHEKIVHIEYNQINSGSTFKQWEKGINLAKGDWIWIAESDDVAEVEFLEKMLSNNTNSEVGLIYCCSRIINDLSKPDELYGFRNIPSKDVYPRFNTDFIQEGDSFIDEWMLKDNMLPNASAVLINRKYIDKALFDNLNNMRLMGDWLFWIRFLKKANVFYYSSILNNFRTHKDTVRINNYNNRTLEFPYIIKEFHRKDNRRKVLVDTFLYRYYTSDYFKMFALKDHLFVFYNCLIEGVGFKYIKSLINKLIQN